MKTLYIIAMIELVMMSTGCAGTSLGDVRNTAPLQTATIQAEPTPLANCVRQHIETDSWRFGQPVVHSTDQANLPIRVHAMYSRSTLFEFAFHPVAPNASLVEYRRSYDGYGTQEQAWGIIERCATQLSGASTKTTP